MNQLSAIPLSAELLSRTPPEVIELLLRLLPENQALRTEITHLRARIEELEARLNKNSSNSSKPPSSDSPFVKRPEVAKKSKKPHKRKGMRQQCLRPTELVELQPGKCSCGCGAIVDPAPYYIQQVIELPAIEANVSHIILYRGHCRVCGKMVKAHIPQAMRTGFGPRVSAMMAALVAIHGDSRRAVQDFMLSVIGVPVSQGAIQKVLDRVSRAIGEAVHSVPVNHIDETTWKRNKTLEWLWLMCNEAAALFMLHGNRSKAAFHALIKDWQGILISDDYMVYQQWAHGRQTCLAHLVREAKGLTERKNPELSRPGTWALKELRLLCRMAKHPPSVGQWNMFYARLIRLIGLYREQPDEAGQFVRRIERELECLWLFLQEKRRCADK